MCWGPTDMILMYAYCGSYTEFNMEEKLWWYIFLSIEELISKLIFDFLNILFFM